MKIPKAAQNALEMLDGRGYEAFLVGGAVRDLVMGRPRGDIDITTSALPQQTEEVFKGCQIVETGLKHGTVTVILDGVPIEITTYRTEGGYKDGRHPDKVEFTASLYADSARRDFTINSLCYNPRRGLIDYHGGLGDIKTRLIRCIGAPNDRFREDGLRIMRRVRFAAVLGFDIEEETARSARENRDMLKNISAERLYIELKKAVCGENIRSVLIEYRDIFDKIAPGIGNMEGFEQKNIHHIYDVLEHTAAVMENLPRQPILRLAGLFHDIGKPNTFTVDENGTGHFYGHAEKSREIAREILTRLKAPKADTEAVCTLVKYHGVNIDLTEKGVRRALNKYGEDTLRRLVALKRADNQGQNIRLFDHSNYYNALEELIDRQVSDRRCFSLKSLSVKGDDLTSLGLPPSPQLGKVLNILLKKVIDGDLPNEKDTLIKYVIDQKLDKF